MSYPSTPHLSPTGREAGMTWPQRDRKAGLLEHGTPLPSRTPGRPLRELLNGTASSLVLPNILPRSSIRLLFLHRHFEMPAEYLSAERLSELKLLPTPEEVVKLVENALDETGSGAAHTEKLVTYADVEKKRSLLSHHCFNSRYAGFKTASSAVNNPRIGLPRYSMTFTLLDPNTLRDLVRMDGTDVSLDRTSALPVISVNRLLPGELELEVFVFGAGPYADRCITFFLALLAFRIKRLSIKGAGTDNSQKLAAKHREGHDFPVEAVDNLDHLPTANVFIFATSGVWRPLFEMAQIKPHGPLVMIHLSEGTEIPPDYIEQAKHDNALVCDGAMAVWKRNGQSVPRYLREQGFTETSYQELGIRELHQMKGLSGEQCNKRWLVTGVGLATTDLPLVGCIWEKWKSQQDQGLQVMKLGSCDMR